MVHEECLDDKWNLNSTFLVEPSWSTPLSTAITAMVWMPALKCPSHVRGCCQQIVIRTKMGGNWSNQLKVMTKGTATELLSFRTCSLLTGSMSPCQGEKKPISFSKGSWYTHLWLLSAAILPIKLQTRNVALLEPTRFYESDRTCIIAHCSRRCTSVCTVRCSLLSFEHSIPSICLIDRPSGHYILYF